MFIIFSSLFLSSLSIYCLETQIIPIFFLQNSINKEQSKEYLNKSVEILCEGYDEKKDMYLGRDTYGRMAYFKGNSNDIGQFVNIKITKTGGISLVGERIDWFLEGNYGLITNDATLLAN